MEECKYTPFGLDVKMALFKKGKTQAWLIEEVKSKTELFFDDSYLYKVLTGQREPFKIVDAIKEILEMEASNEGIK